MNIETVPPTGTQLLEQRRTDAHWRPGLRSLQQRPPTAAEIEHSAARPDADLLGHVPCLRRSPSSRLARRHRRSWRR